MTFALVVAADEGGGIGKNGELPWRLPGDLAFFRRQTTATLDQKKRNAVIMGRRTWESVPDRFRPLPSRLNVVVTHDPNYDTAGKAIVATSLEDVLSRARAAPDIETLFIIGGGVLYRDALAHPACQTVYLTRIEGHRDCDAFFPPLEASFVLAEASARHEENGVGYVFQRWERERFTPASASGSTTAEAARSQSTRRGPLSP